MTPVRDVKRSKKQKWKKMTTCDGVVVRSSLQSGKHGLVNQRLQVVQSLFSFGIHIPHS